MPVVERLVVVRHLELVHRLVERGVGVDVGPERRTEAAQHVDQLVLGELLGAVEQHVLDEVGDAGAGSGLVDRAGVDRQPQRGLGAGTVVVAHVVPQPVVERAGADDVVVGDRLVGRVEQPGQGDLLGRFGRSSMRGSNRRFRSTRRRCPTSDEPVGTAVSSLTSSSGVQAARASRPAIREGARRPLHRRTLRPGSGDSAQVAHSLAPISATYGPVSPKSM